MISPSSIPVPTPMPASSPSASSPASDSPLAASIASARRLLRDAGAFAAVPGIGRMRQRLEGSLRLAAGSGAARPVSVALVGGTGAGKSELFNLLVGDRNASRVSHAERGFTSRPHIAVLPSEAPLVPIAADAKAVFVNKALPGLALIDTPDLDSAMSEHRVRARHAIEAADIVVYVALPEKRSSFIITDELKEWASRKHWFFVLNKVDRCDPDDVGQIRADFAGRIADLGFATDDATLFLISATKPDHAYSELSRLRAAIYSGRTTEAAGNLRDAGFYRALLHGADDEALAPARQLHGQLAAAHTELTGRVREIHERVLTSPTIRDNLSDMVRARVWRQMPSRVGGFLAFPLWVMARLHQLWMTFSLSRLALGGFSIASVAHTLWTAASAWLRGVVPLQAVLAGFKRQELEELRGVRIDAIRKVEDAGMEWIETDSDGVTIQADPENQGGSGAESKGTLASVWNRPLIAGGEADKGELLNCLLEAVERSAAEGAGRAVGWTHRFFGNLLPLAVFVDVTRKSLIYWHDDAWLPGDFYLMAIFLFILASVPGCLLVGAAVRSRAVVTAADDLLAGLQDPWETEPLRVSARQLDAFLRRAAVFRRQAQEQLLSLESDLPTGRFGARLNAAE